MPRVASGHSEHFKTRENRLAAGAPPWTPLGELTALPDSIAGGEGTGCLYPPQEPHPRSRPCGPRSDFGASGRNFLRFDRKKSWLRPCPPPGLNIFLRLWLSAQLKAIANSTTSTIVHVRQLTALEETRLSSAGVCGISYYRILASSKIFTFKTSLFQI